MKKILITLLLVAFAAAPAFAVVKDSVHDLSIGGGYDKDGVGGKDTAATTDEVRICAFCHTPHHAIDSLDYAPLWAHDSSTETFTPYSSPTLEADRGGDALRGGSRLCMGCHDGAVAPDAYYGMAGTEIAPGNDAWNGFGIAEGGDMTNDHPVGFSYGQAIGADATANGGYSQFNSPGTTLASLGLAGKAGTGIVTVSNLLRAVAGGPSDLVTCASCHDVHNSAQVFTDDAGMNVKAQDYLLYVTQEDSGLCVTCHAK